MRLRRHLVAAFVTTIRNTNSFILRTVMFIYDKTRQQSLNNPFDVRLLTFLASQNVYETFVRLISIAFKIYINYSIYITTVQFILIGEICNL